MKILIATFLFGLASASFYQVLDHAADQAVLEFMVGMEKVPSLKQVVGYDLGVNVDEIEEDIKTELGKTLKETLDNVLQKIKDSLDHGKEVSKDLLDKAKDIVGQLKDLGIDAGTKALELLNRLKERLRDWVKSLLEKLGIGKRNILDILRELIKDLDLRAILIRIRDKIIEKVNIESIVNYIREKLKDKTELVRKLLEIIKNQGIDALRDLIDRILNIGGQYSIIELWQKIKNFFKDLGIKIQEKFFKFAEWVKSIWSVGLEAAKDKLAKVKIIAQEVRNV
ncbi:uncharacterized protein LOC106461472 isoform X2 [Limulus polyphemus]|uniref:Uncharacterized protein LOC106461472 isoform X2 n=1 Tax=Limulus polyphemus TaxID=6850 RepID=A0ABM1SKJ5_LIMPO|nr:uncharacterized protein LOC106461472 isoform X2 [Limulus polyphemus]